METNPKLESERERSKAIFKNLLDEDGWMRDPDGEDHCGSCFGRYCKHLEKMPPNLGRTTLSRTLDLTGTRERKFPPFFGEEKRKQVVEAFKSDSKPTSLMVDEAPKTTSCLEGWYASCNGPGGKDPNTKSPNQCPEHSNILVSWDGKIVEVNKQNPRTK